MKVLGSNHYSHKNNRVELSTKMIRGLPITAPQPRDFWKAFYTVADTCNNIYELNGQPFIISDP